MNQELKRVLIYTDGAAEPNPGPGGYGVVLICEGHRREIRGGFRLTTNNRMEIFAAIAGLHALNRPCDVTLYSDSKYLVDASIKGWIQLWKENGWRRNRKHLLANADLWQQLLQACSSHRVDFQWVKGHAGNVENECCDTLSLRMLGNTDLPPDEGYENVAMKQIRHNHIDDAVTEPPVSPGKKVLVEGDLCRKCFVPLVKRTPRRKERRENQEFYFEYYLHCEKCRRIYMTEAGKRFF